MNIPDMKILFLGSGSIGKRHIKNLISLGCQNPVIFDPIDTKISYQSLLNEKFDVVFVCSPTAFHVQQALDFARKGSHLFIEKPLGHSIEGTQELLSEVKKRKLTTMVGCNMRFHPAIHSLKEALDSNLLGNIYHFRLEAAGYLPDWRPGTDYRNNYGAQKKLGGGIILDGIHEIDYALWLFGPAEEVSCTAGKLSDLEIDVEDVAEISVRTKTNAIGSIYLSYAHFPYQRGYEVSGEKGTIRWKSENNFVEVCTRGNSIWKQINEFPNYDVNQCYLDMIQYFFDCIEKGQDTFSNVSVGLEALNLSLKAREISESKSKQHELTGKTL